MIDWNAIKAEYIAGGISQRKLAEAHKEEGVTFGALKDRAQRERWTALRDESSINTAQKLTETITDAKITKIKKIVDKLLEQTYLAAKQANKLPKTIQTTKKMPDGSVRVTVKREYADAKGVDKAGLRLLAQTVKDLDELLRRQRMEAAGVQTGGVTVIFDAADEDLTV